MDYSRFSRRGRFVPLLDDVELKKFEKFATKLERQQRSRFAQSEDPYNFFESAFELEVRAQIAEYRERVRRTLEIREQEANHCDDPNCPYQDQDNCSSR